jgi:hypothetical protein
MMEASLAQTEADALIAMEKHRMDDQRWDYPILGGAISIPLMSIDKREKFLLDISRGRIDLLKATYQNRSRQVIVLLRLDLGGAPHRNPDDTEVPTSHLHIYRQGYGDKWAIPIPQDKFSNVEDIWEALQDFMSFCNVTRKPIIERVMF